MHLLGVPLTLCAFLVFANAFVARPDELIQSYEVDDVDVPDSGKCHCTHWGCWCYAWDDNTEIHVILSTDEFRDCKCCDAIIDAKIYIAKSEFEVQFSADRLEDFCKTVNGKRFCFRIDIKEKRRGNDMHACLYLSRPHKLNVGCFKLPLMSEECALQRNILE